MRSALTFSVMAGLDPAIHVVPERQPAELRRGVDARNKSGHDELNYPVEGLSI